MGDDADQDLIKHYEDMMVMYGEERRTLEMAFKMSDGENMGHIKPEDIATIIKGLFDLQLNGKKLREMYGLQERAIGIEHQHENEYMHTSGGVFAALKRNAVMAVGEVFGALKKSLLDNDRVLNLDLGSDEELPIPAKHLGKNNKKSNSNTSFQGKKPANKSNASRKKGIF